MKSIPESIPLPNATDRLLGRLGLCFANSLDKESRFIQETYECNTKSAGIVFLIGAILYLLFSYWDYVVDHNRFELTTFIRCLVCSAALYTSKKVYYKDQLPNIEAVQLAIMTTMSVALICIYAVLKNGFVFGGVGPVMLILFHGALIRGRFKFHMAFCGITLIFFIFAQQFFSSYIDGSVNGMGSGDLLLINFMEIFVTSVIVLLSVANKERSERRFFELKMLMEQHQTDMDKLGPLKENDKATSQQDIYS